ncbi:MAG: hypothetical protein WA705_00160 [Candidatus Ozemobacteraceae bacterium]
MQTRRLIFSLFLLLLFSSSGFASGKPISSGDEITAMRKELAAVREEMSDMRNRYESAIAQFEQRISQLAAGTERTPVATGTISAVDERARLKSAALGELSQAPANSFISAPASQPVVFTAGDQALQVLNPEISLTGDVISQFRSQDQVRENARATFRSLGVHGEGYLDPQTRFKTAFPITENGTELGEAYITRVGFAKDLNLTLGKFHQQFGVVSRWHQHALDQVDFPLALRRLFGGPLNQIGVSFDWQLPSGAGTGRELTMQVTNAKNGAIFGQNTRGVPCLLLHYKQFRDLTASTYAEWGLTGLAGANDRWTIGAAPATTIHDESLPTFALGLDFTRLWEPTDRMRYRNFLWRTEGYFLARDLVTTAGNRDTARAWGAYTNFQWKLNRKLESGIRLDYYRPDEKPYAPAIQPTVLYANALHIAPGNNPYEFQISPYWTWHQSPWVRYRLEFDYRKGHNMEKDDRRITLQCIWAAGPHLHDRY